LALSIAVLLAFGLTGFAAAQMMGGHQTTMGKADSTSMSNNMMGKGMMGSAKNMNSMMGNVNQHWKMMSNDFDRLEQHLNKMMKMDNMKALKAEMQKHHEMMAEMQQSMMKQQHMDQRMMSMMQNGNMHGMMGMNAKSGDKSEHQPQNH